MVTSLPDAGLIAWCPICPRPGLVTRRNWEPQVSAYLCLERRWNRHDGLAGIVICDAPVVILTDQDAALAAYYVGGWPAVVEMAKEQWIVEHYGGR